MTIVSAGIVANATQSEAGRALIAFLTSPVAFPILRAQGPEAAADAQSN